MADNESRLKVQSCLRNAGVPKYLLTGLENFSQDAGTRIKLCYSYTHAQRETIRLVRLYY
jgi:hypothetical protein